MDAGSVCCWVLVEQALLPVPMRPGDIKPDSQECLSYPANQSTTIGDSFGLLVPGFSGTGTLACHYAPRRYQTGQPRVSVLPGKRIRHYNPTFLVSR
jgi:hypothetical protein